MNMDGSAYSMKKQDDMGDFWNSDWAALFPALGLGLQGFGIINDLNYQNQAIDQAKDDIGLGFKRSMKALDRQGGSIADSMTSGMTDGAAVAAAAGIGGASAEIGKQGMESRYSRAMADLADERAYQETMKDRQLQRLEDQRGAANLNGVLQGIGAGLGAVGSIAENNWFGLADSKSRNRGAFFRRMG